MQLWLRLPDEARSLPPPPLFTFASVWMGFVGWTGALIENALNRRPILASGVHRQILWASVGFYIGHYLVKRANYTYAKRDKEISEYIRHHPEDFVKQEKKTMAEVLEKFYPVR